MCLIRIDFMLYLIGFEKFLHMNSTPLVSLFLENSNANRNICLD